MINDGHCRQQPTTKLEQQWVMMMIATAEQAAEPRTQAVPMPGEI
jgi:hypothetical protein